MQWKEVTPTDPQEAVQADGHPVGQQLLHDGLGASQQQLGLRVAVLLHQISEQNLHRLRQVRQVAVKRHGEQRRHFTPETVDEADEGVGHQGIYTNL